MLQWNYSDFPPAFNTLDGDVRNQAIDDANERLSAGAHPIRALSSALAKAMDPSTRTVSPFHVYFHEGHWCVWDSADRSDETTLRFGNYEDALRRATELAKEAQSALYAFSSDDALIETFEYYSTNGTSDMIEVMPVDDGWAVRTRTPDTSGRRFDTKAEAREYAKKLGDEKGLCLRTYYQDGKVQATKDLSD